MEAAAGEFVRRWTGIGRSTEPADRPRAEAAVGEAYRAGGLPPPARVVWCGSPLSLLVARAMACGVSPGPGAGRLPPSVLAASGACLASARRSPPGPSVAAAIRGQVLEAAARSAAGPGDLHEAARASAEVRGPVERSVEFGIALPLLFAAEEALGASVEGIGYGQHDAGGLSFHDYLAHRRGRSPTPDPIRGLGEIAASAGWLAPHARVCWIAERPLELRLDGQGRLHAERGPAVRFRDGWTVHAREGIVLSPEEVRGRDLRPVAAGGGG